MRADDSSVPPTEGDDYKFYLGENEELDEVCFRDIPMTGNLSDPIYMEMAKENSIEQEKKISIVKKVDEKGKTMKYGLLIWQILVAGAMLVLLWQIVFT